MSMWTIKDPVENQVRSSAFTPVGACPKPHSVVGSSTRKRDSGYSSDLSPARVKSQDRSFTFDDDDLCDDVGDDVSVFNGIDEVDISADEDVFVNQLGDTGMSVIVEQEDSEDEAMDKEVQLLFDERTDSDTQSGQVTHSGHIHRPSAPLPSPVLSASSSVSNSADRLSNFRDEASELCLIASPFYHTQWTMKDRVLYRNLFRPIVSRSVGTQTPNPHCQLVQDAFRSNTQMLNRDSTSSRRLQVQSLSEHLYSSLPDVVPMSRDRSASLPDVQSFHHQQQQQQVGRELRRISDDFHSVYLKRQGRRSRTRSEDTSLLRIRVDVPACWNTFRRFVSSSPLFQAWSSDNH